MMTWTAIGPLLPRMQWGSRAILCSAQIVYSFWVLAEGYGDSRATRVSRHCALASARVISLSSFFLRGVGHVWASRELFLMGAVGLTRSVHSWGGGRSPPYGLCYTDGYSFICSVPLALENWCFCSCLSPTTHSAIIIVYARVSS